MSGHVNAGILYAILERVKALHSLAQVLRLCRHPLAIQATERCFSCPNEIILQTFLSLNRASIPKLRRKTFE